MDRDRVVVATVTLARDDEERWAILNGLSLLSEHQFPAIVAVDGGSDERFLAAAVAIPRVIVERPQEPGLIGQVKASLRLARDRADDHVFYTEPNKPWFFERRLGRFLEQAAERVGGRPEVGLVLLARTPESFATFPAYQRHAESLASDLIRFAVGRDAPEDYLYGPRLIAPGLVRYLDELEADIGWGWMSFLLVMAHRLGQTIDVVPLDLPCPPEERAENLGERLLRLRQMRDHVGGVHEALRVEA